MYVCMYVCMYSVCMITARLCKSKTAKKGFPNQNGVSVSGDAS